MRLLAVFALLFGGAAVGAAARIVLIAGDPSHYVGAHEHNAGMLLLEKCLRQNEGVEPVFVRGGWPEDDRVLENAQAIVFYSDGAAKHPALAGNRLELLSRLADRGTGLGFLHFAVEVPKERGGPELLRWIGGFYDRPYSQNPVNEVNLAQASPDHPISRGWRGFAARDEWYYRIVSILRRAA